MRQLATVRIASRAQTTLHPRPAILQSYGWEHRGDPGPSSFRTLTSSSRDEAGVQRTPPRRTSRPLTGFGVSSGRGGSQAARSSRDGGRRETARTQFGMSKKSEASAPDGQERRPTFDRGVGRGGARGFRGSGRGGHVVERPGSTNPAPEPAATPVKPVKLSNRQIASKQMESERPVDHRGDPHTTSARITAWIKKRESPINPQEVGELVRMVQDAPRYRVNTVVWNQLISILGRERLLHIMWSAFQNMKKRGYEPNSRTYTIMLNAYAGAKHMDDPLSFTPTEKPNERKWQQILSVYNESQTFIMDCINRLKAKQAYQAQNWDQDEKDEEDDDSEVQVQGPTRSGYTSKETMSRAELRAQITPTPTNAYIKLLARYGMWSQLDKVHLAMDKDGPLSPNTRTYQMLFAALLDRRAQQSEKRWTAVSDEAGKPMSLEDFGSTARLMFEELVRRFHPVTPPSTRKADETRVLDDELAITAIKALMLGRPMDQQLGLHLSQHIWRLPQYQSAVTASATSQGKAALITNDTTNALPGFMQNIPKFTLTSDIASTLLTLLNKASKKTPAVTWARYIYDNRSKVKGEITFDLARSMIFAAGAAGDQDFVTDIMETYQPPTGKSGWASYIWENVMLASWARGDFDRALINFRKMTHLAYGTEEGEPEEQRRKYAWHRPRKQERDINGNVFYRPDPQIPTPKVMSLLLRSAFGTNNAAQVDRNVRKGYNIFTSYPIDIFFTIPEDEFKRGVKIDLLRDRADEWEGEIHASLQHAAEWRINLAKDVKKVVEYMITSAAQGEKKELTALSDKMARVVDTWGPKFFPARGGKGNGRNVQLRQGSVAPRSRESGMPSSTVGMEMPKALRGRSQGDEEGSRSDRKDGARNFGHSGRNHSTRGPSRGFRDASGGYGRGGARGRGGPYRGDFRGGRERSSPSGGEREHEVTI